MKGFLGIDPGQKGAFVFLKYDASEFEFYEMPLDPQGDVSFVGVLELLEKFPPLSLAWLERAIPFAMGAKHAFNYGRGFAAIEHALFLSKMPVVYVEPGKWAKVMHQGIDANLKPKVKSVVAVERLFPKLAPQIPKGPKSGKYHDGVLEALLIAGYAQRGVPALASKMKLKVTTSDF